VGSNPTPSAPGRWCQGLVLSIGICWDIPTDNSHQVLSPPWKSFGNRLFKRGNAFFIRVRIPRDLQDL